MTTSRCTAATGVAWTDARPAGRGLAAAVARLADGWHRRQAVRALQSLEDRQLRDLGIERGQIETVAEALIATRRARSP